MISYILYICSKSFYACSQSELSTIYNCDITTWFMARSQFVLSASCTKQPLVYIQRMRNAPCDSFSLAFTRIPALEFTELPYYLNIWELLSVIEYVWEVRYFYTSDISLLSHLRHLCPSLISHGSFTLYRSRDKSQSKYNSVCLKKSCCSW